MAAPTPEPLTFCTSFLSLRKYVEDTHGSGAFKRVREELDKRHGLALPAVITPGSWLPTRAFAKGLGIGRELFGPDDFCARFGAAAAEYELKWVHRVVLRFTSPNWILERCEEVWRNSHTTGRWEIQGGGGKRYIKGALYDFGVVDKNCCDSLRAWVQRACAMTGADKVAVVETQCRAKGAEACVFEGSW